MKKTVLMIPLLVILLLLNITFSFASSTLNQVRGSVVSNITDSLNNNDDGEWNRTFGGPYNDKGLCVQQTSDGGYIIAGERGLPEWNESAWIIKTDAYGNKIWERILDEYALYVEETSDGGYIVTGSTDDEFLWLIKLDEYGNTLWEHRFGGLGMDGGFCVHETSDGGFIIAGHTSSYSYSFDAWLIKTDSDGNMIWNKTYGSGSWAGGAFYVEETSDGGFVLAGLNYKGGWIIRTDSNGNKIWDSSFGGEGTDFLKCVHETGDGGFIAAGWTRSFGNGLSDMWLIKLDKDGNMLWNKTYGGGSYDTCNFLEVDDDGGFVLVGSTASYSRYSGKSNDDLWVVKTDRYGNKVWGRILGGKDNDLGNYIQKTDDGGYIIVGTSRSYSSGGDRDIWLVKIMPDNLPPSKPVVTGSSTAKINKPYTINITSVDPEGDDIYYFVIVWYVGVSGWIGPYRSGEMVSFTVFNPCSRGCF